MSDTQSIKDKLDIVDFISDYVQLKPAGINHKGICPFHQEKSPSFMVNRQNQVWHCFGCSKGGDIFSFVEEIEGLEFIEALKLLADKAGIELQRGEGAQIDSSKKNRIKQINTEAARFYHHFLLRMPISRPAYVYLESRGLSEKTIEEWQIGFIPVQWDLLTQYLLKKGYGIEDLVDAGITIKRDQTNSGARHRYYDRFRGRIMFPIRDVHGSILGFTGRLLKEDPSAGGKYVNTPQTLLYDKSRVLFGLEKAKQEIRSRGFIIVVEGQMDVISSHQVGQCNVVASSGTAFTGEQIALIKRFTKNIRMAFDTDSAGVSATERGIDLALEAGLAVDLIELPPGAGKDPADCIQRDKNLWFKAVESTKPVMKWHLDRILGKSHLDDLKQKQEAVDLCLQKIRKIPYAVERDYWLKELASRTEVDHSILREDLKRIHDEAHQLHPGAQHSPVFDSRKPNKDLNDTSLMLVEEVFGLLLGDTELASLVFSLNMEEILSTYPAHAELYGFLKTEYTEHASLDIETIRGIIPENLRQLFLILLMRSELAFSNTELFDPRKELISVLERLKKEKRFKKTKDLSAKMAEAEHSGDHALLQSLIKEFQELD